MLRQVVCPYVRATPSLQGTQLYLLAKVIIFHQFSTFLCLLFEGQQFPRIRLCFSQRILSFLMFFTLISMMRDQDSIIRWQTISEEVKIILIGFLMLDTSEKGDFSCFFHRKNLLLHNNKRRNIKRWNDVLTT